MPFAPAPWTRASSRSSPRGASVTAGAGSRPRPCSVADHTGGRAVVAIVPSSVRLPAGGLATAESASRSAGPLARSVTLQLPRSSTPGTSRRSSAPSVASVSSSAWAATAPSSTVTPPWAVSDARSGELVAATSSSMPASMRLPSMTACPARCTVPWTLVAGPLRGGGGS